MSTPGSGEALTIAALEVVGVAPPTPSSSTGSAAPYAATSIRANSARSAGTWTWWNNQHLLVPPRTRVAGMCTSEALP